MDQDHPAVLEAGSARGDHVPAEECLRLLWVVDPDALGLLTMIDVGGKERLVLTPQQVARLRELLMAWSERGPAANEQLSRLQQTNKRFTVDSATRRVFRGNTEILNLGPMEYGLLELLWRADGAVVDREQICEQMWETLEINYGHFERLYNLIQRVRIAIEPDPQHPEYLLTVKRRGFRLEHNPSMY